MRRQVGEGTSLRRGGDAPPGNPNNPRDSSRKRKNVKVYEIKSFDLSDLRKINRSTMEIVKKKDVIFHKRTRLEQEMLELKKEKATNRRDFGKAAVEDMFRTNVKVSISTLALDIFMVNTNRVYFVLASILLLCICQIGFLLMDVMKLRKARRSTENKYKIRYLGVRIGKNILILLNTLVILVEIGNENLDKWMLPYEIVLVLYFVVIIYFIINTGEMMFYVKTVLFNIIVFIELFFVQKIVQGAAIQTMQADFFQSVWIYEVMLSIYVLIFIYIFSKGVGKLLLNKCSKQASTNSTYVYSMLLLDSSSIVMMLSVSTLHFKVTAYSILTMVIVSICSLLSGALIGVSYLLLKRKFTLIKDEFTNSMAAIEKEEGAREKKEEKIDKMEIPYYLIKAADNYYRVADKYDLLKLSITEGNKLYPDDINSQGEDESKKEVVVDENKVEMRLEKYTRKPGDFKFIRKEMKTTKAPTSSRHKINEGGEDEVDRTDRSNSEKSNRRSDKMSIVDHVCFICCDRFHTCVNMNCGHGGICMRCGLDMWNRNEACFLCKQPVDYLLEIDPTPVVNMCRVMNAIVPDSAANAPGNMDLNVQL